MKYTSNRFLHTRFWSFKTRLVTTIGMLAVVGLVPLSVYYFTQHSTQNQSNASASTTLSFSQQTLQTNSGSPITVDITMNPGNNYVSLATLVIDYDSSQITPDTTKGIVPNTQLFPQTLDGPTYNTCNGNQCTMSISLSVGNDPTKAIKTAGTIATVNFTPVAQNSTTQLAFDKQSQVFSVAPSDQANENVLSTTTPVTITIGQGSATSPTPFPTDSTPQPTQPQDNTSPTQPISDTSPTNPPTSGGSNSPTPKISPTPKPPLVCKERDDDDDDNKDDKELQKKISKLRQHIDNLEDSINKVVKQRKKLSKDQKLKFADTLEGNLSQSDTTAVQLEKVLQIGTNTNGGCLGNFDPTNPNVVNDCNQPNNVQGGSPLNTTWGTIVNTVAKLFGWGK